MWIIRKPAISMDAIKVRLSTLFQNAPKESWMNRVVHPLNHHESTGTMLRSINSSKRQMVLDNLSPVNSRGISTLLMLSSHLKEIAAPRREEVYILTKTVLVEEVLEYLTAALF